MRLISLFPFYLLLAGCSSIRPAEAMAVDPVYHANTTRKMFQVTGDFDRPLRRDTASLTETNSGMAATDLGSSPTMREGPFLPCSSPTVREGSPQLRP